MIYNSIKKIMKKNVLKIGITFIIFVPTIISAAGMDFKGFVTFIIDNFIEPATFFIMSLAVVYFLWNIVGVIRSSDEKEVLEKFKEKALWGIIALAVMVSMWSLVYIITNSLKLDNESKIVIPTYK